MAYAHYLSRPVFLSDTAAVIGGGTISRRDDGVVLLKLTGSPDFPAEELIVEKDKIFDLAPPTMYGLLDDLIPGSSLSDSFLEEFERFSADLENPKKNFKYGAWIYYPHKKHLVRFAPPFWHKTSLLLRNSTLLRDPECKLDWQSIRDIFEKTVVAVAGCSVGNNAIHAVVGDMRPAHVKVADQKNFHMPNANRVRLTYEDLGKNKAVTTAEQLHAIDPFMNVSVFGDGIHEGNLKDFIAGNEALREPKASVVIEETDDPDMKIFIREEARRNGVPVVMVSDLGAAVQLDIRRFDQNADLPLAPCGVLDEELYKKRDAWRRDLADRRLFWEFAFALIGTNYKKLPEFKSIIMKEEPPLFASVPQLGSTAMMAGGMAAGAVARIMLGFQLPERMLINKHTGEVIIDGARR